MGNGGSVEAFGIKFSWKSANPADREKIDAFVQAAGFEKC
jgi:hypothetical protein